MSSNKKSLMYIMIMLALMPLALAQDFSLFADSQPGDLCPGTTGLFTDVLRNEDTASKSFTISTTGTASSFSTTVPTGFTLSPGQSKTIFTYVSPRSTTNVGTYALDIKATSEGETQSITHSFNVRDCYLFSLESLNNEQTICPSESERFEYSLSNNGEYTESYQLSVENRNLPFVELSTETLTLNPGERSNFFAYVGASTDKAGEYDFTVNVKSLNSNKVISSTNTLNVDSCYDFNIETERDLANMCDRSEETIPITITNDGSTQNTYNLDVQGPLWANVERNALTISPNSESTVNLILNPDYNVEGSFEITLTAESQKGEVTALRTFNANVRTCHGVTLDIEKSEDRICNSLENSYIVNVRNIGEFQKEFTYSIDGPSWANLDRQSSTLGPGEEDEITLTINPSFDTPKASYIVTVEASASDSSQVSSSDNIDVSTVTTDECYQASLGLEKRNVEVFYDSSATVPIIVENKGTYTTTYDLAIAGTAANFAYLNPSTVELESGKSEIVYLYIAPSGQVTNGDYSLTITARSGDTSILSSENINIEVTDSGFVPPEESPQEGRSLWEMITGFFSAIFSSDSTEETSEEIDINLTEDEIIDEINDTTEDIEDEIEEITLEELDSRRSSLSQGDTDSFLINEEEHSIEITDINGESLTITLNSDPVLVNMEPGDVKKADLDDDGVYDVEISYFGLNEDGSADIEYEQISEPVEQDTQEDLEDNNETTINDLENITGEVITDDVNEGEGFFSSFFSSLSTIFSGAASSGMQILWVIIIVLVIYFIFKTGFHKKIADFFEEEIEEEDVPMLGEDKKKEGPKKEEKLKEEKKEKKESKPKETKKEKKSKKELNEDTEDEIEIKGLDEDTEDDKEDFIIEFDDEDEEDDKKKK